MMLEGHSLLAVAAALCLLLGLVVLALERRLSQPVAGLRIWAVSNVALATGAALHVLQGYAPDWFGFAGNAFMLVGRAAAVVALLQFDRRRVPWWALGALVLVVMAALWVTSGAGPNLPHRAFILLSGLALLSAWAAAVVLTGGPASVGRIVASAGLVGMALAHVSRLALHAGAFAGERILDLTPSVIEIHLGLVVTLDTLVNVGFVLLVTERMHDWLLQQARTDHLTGALARGAFHALAMRDLQRARRQGSVTSAIVVDVDRFKEINDESGHAAGDNVLKRVARHGQEVLRCTDLFCRHGGDEFVALLPDTDLLTATAIAERLRLAVADAGPGLPPDLPAVTVSIGVASVARGGHDIDTLIAQADAALYHAKRAGRNRTRVSDAATAPPNTSLQLIQGRRSGGG
ncbi:MAG TPA: GGDEF domain-containing protein [Burkholderiaceae bacterium]|jgi:diguanylate cyclase (GGDEF)-like protein|nr:GGDEF domain-containing protein [Burkholderiaceae bacterium]